MRSKLVPNPLGGYLFLPGLPFLSFAVLAAEGFEIVRATFRRPPAFSEAFAAIEGHLRSSGRPLHALCGLELRSGRQATPQEFAAFNGPYTECLREVGLLVGDRVPMTRTNVAVPGGEGTHQLFAFSYTVPVPRPASQQSPTFVLAAVPEVRNIGSQPEVVAAGDTSIEGLRQKSVFVLEALESSLEALGVVWSDVTGVQLYTLSDLHRLCTKSPVRNLTHRSMRSIRSHSDDFSRPDRPISPIKTPPRNDFLCKAGLPPTTLSSARHTRSRRCTTPGVTRRRGMIRCPTSTGIRNLVTAATRVDGGVPPPDG